MTLSPGAQSGLFSSVGRLDPHSYRPNEFFANNWVYEGLVKYGANGAVEPSLASSWTTTVDSDNIETITFTLREGVTFHDGAEWNCDVAKLNFDHVFAEPLKGPWWHGWYSLPTALDSWSCDSDDNFVIMANKPYYPLLQELTYIRPLRMLSPLAFVNGLTTSAITDNSCPTGWGSATCTDGDWDGASDDCEDITCAGTIAISGTGPFQFISRTTRDDDDAEDDLVIFKSFNDYWDGDSDLDFVHLVRYDDADAVLAALVAGELDAVIGAGVLDPDAVHDLMYDDGFEVQHTDAMMNSVVIMNSRVDIDLRKTVVHAVDKGHIITKELGGIEKAVYQLFPQAAPNCNVYLTPKFDYDIERAETLNCRTEDTDAPTTAPAPTASTGTTTTAPTAKPTVMGHVPTAAPTTSKAPTTDEEATSTVTTKEVTVTDEGPVMLFGAAAVIFCLASAFLGFKLNKTQAELYQRVGVEPGNK